jgi:hypothetical protein
MIMGRLAKHHPIAATLAAVAVPFTSALAAAEILPEVVRAQREAAAGLSEISLTWRSKRQSSAELSRLKVDFGDAQKFLMPEEQSYESHGEMKYYFTTFFSRINGVLVGEDWAVSFDGDSVFHRIGQADIGRVNPLGKLRVEAPNSILYEVRYLTFAGYWARVTTATLRDPIRPMIEALLGEGGEAESVEPSSTAGRPTRTITLSHRGERRTFLTDPSMGHAVVRSETVAEGGLRTTVVNDDFARHGEYGPWLPRRCRIAWFRPADAVEPLAVEELTVERMGRPDPSPSRYALEFEPGTLVSDFRLRSTAGATEDQITYVMTARPKDLDCVARDAATSTRPDWRKWLAPASAAAVVLIFAIVPRLRRNGRAN